MKKQYIDWGECKSLKEVFALRTLEHSNIVTLNELILEKNELIMVFEFIGQNLFEYLKNFEKFQNIKYVIYHLEHFKIYHICTKIIFFIVI